MPKSWPLHNGEIDIGFPMGGGSDERDRCTITLHDTKSRVVLFEVQVEFDAFFRAVLGRGRTPVTFEAHPQIGDYIGATKEQKSLPIFVPRSLGHIADAETKRYTGKDFHGNPLTTSDVAALDLIDQTLKPYETNGWKATVADVLNWHCVSKEEFPAGVQAQLREDAGFNEQEAGDIRNVTLSRWIRADGKVVK